MFEPANIDDARTLSANASTEVQLYSGDDIYVLTGLTIRSRDDGQFRAEIRFDSQFAAPDGVITVADQTGVQLAVVKYLSDAIFVGKKSTLDVRLADQSGSENEIKINAIAAKFLHG